MMFKQPQMVPLIKPLDWEGIYKSKAEDFKVFEFLKPPFNDLAITEATKPDPNFNHLWLQIEKTYLNTQQVVKFLSQYFEVDNQHITYAGLKDKCARTNQWFSVNLPGKTGKIDLEMLHNFNLYRFAQLTNSRVKLNREGNEKFITEPECLIINSFWSGRKISSQDIDYNKFIIKINSQQPLSSQFKSHIQNFTQAGFVNYFGPQRFGFNGENIKQCCQFFASNVRYSGFMRGLMFSTARAYVFNELLSLRIKNGQGLNLCRGDIIYNHETGQYQIIHRITQDMEKKMMAGTIHPCLPLYGIESNQDVRPSMKWSTEQKMVLEQCQPLCQGLVANDVAMGFRSIRSIPEQLKYQLIEDGLIIDFQLQRGSYATVFLNQLAQIKPANGLD